VALRMWVAGGEPVVKRRKLRYLGAGGAEHGTKMHGVLSRQVLRKRSHLIHGANHRSPIRSMVLEVQQDGRKASKAISKILECKVLRVVTLKMERYPPQCLS